MTEISLAAEKIFTIGPVAVTNSLLSSWLVIGLIIILIALTRRRIGLVPSGLSGILDGLAEYLLTTIDNVTNDRRKTLDFLPFLGTFFLFIVLNNWFGLLPGVGTILINNGEHTVPLLRGGNADLNSTLSLAIISVLGAQYYGIKYLGGLGYAGKFFNFSNPVAFFVGILELFSEFSKMISFSLRLFGNIFAGEVLLIIIAFLVPVLAPLPFFGLEIFVGLIQGLVFTMLTLVFLTIATSSHGEHESAH